MTPAPARPRPIGAGMLAICRERGCQLAHPLREGGRPGVLLVDCPCSGAAFLMVLDGRPLPGVVLVEEARDGRGAAVPNLSPSATARHAAEPSRLPPLPRQALARP